MKTKILVLKGGVSTEHEVSLNSGQMIFEALDRNKYEAASVKIEKDGQWLFEDGTRSDLWNAIGKIKSLKIDVVFLALHGVFGEDGTIQAILGQAGILYTGSGMLASALAMSKDYSNQIYERNGLPVPKYEAYSELPERISLNYPVIVKPADGGSSVGVSIVKDDANLNSACIVAFQNSNSIIIQEFVKGREFSCPVIEDENGVLQALLPIGIMPKISEFFDYKAKYEDGGSEEIVNPNIGEENIKKLQELAMKAHQFLSCSGYSRTDFIERDGIFYVIETNTLPGMTRNSLLPKSAKEAGINFEKLLDLMILSALRKGKS